MGRQLIQTPTLLFNSRGNTHRPVHLLCCEICGIWYIPSDGYMWNWIDGCYRWTCTYQQYNKCSLICALKRSCRLVFKAEATSLCKILSVLSVYRTNAVPWSNLLAGGAECGAVPHKGRVHQTERGAEEDWTVAVRKHQRYHLCSTQVGQKHTWYLCTHKCVSCTHIHLNYM